MILTEIFKQAICSAFSHINHIREDQINVIAEEFMRNHPQIRNMLENDHVQAAIEGFKRTFVNMSGYQLAKIYEKYTTDFNVN